MPVARVLNARAPVRILARVLAGVSVLGNPRENLALRDSGSLGCLNRVFVIVFCRRYLGLGSQGILSLDEYGLSNN